MAEQPQPPGPLEALGEEEGEEPLSPAALRLLEEGDRVAESIVARIRELRSLLSRGELRSALEEWGELDRGVEGLEPGYAVDSTFPIEGGLELVGGHLVAAVAGYVCFRGASLPGLGCHGSHARAWFVESEEARRSVPLRAKLLEKKVANRLLLEAEKTGGGPRLLLVDGEVVPYQLLFKSSRSVASNPVLRHLDEASSMLLERARRLAVTVVGVVKRSYSKLLSARLGSPVPLNDKAVMTLALRRGEYAVAGRFRELLPLHAEALAKARGRSGEKYRRVVEERLRERPLYGEVVVAFYKPWIPGSYAVRVEVLDYGGLGLRRLLSMLASASNPATGLPYPIDVVDEYTRLEARALELLRRRVLRRVAELLGSPAEAAALLAHTNPEKRYIYEPRRGGRG